MIGCEALSDRMPMVAHGESQWTAEEQQHLVACAACAAEWRIVSAGLTLGSYQPKDIDGMAAHLVARLKDEPAVRVLTIRKSAWRWGAPVMMALAASLTLVVYLPRHARNVGTDSTVVAAAPLFPEMLQMDQGQLLDLLKSTEDSADSPPVSAGARLSDLTEAQLQQLLNEVEGGL